MSYDHWKTTDPADEWPGPDPAEDNEEPTPNAHSPHRYTVTVDFTTDEDMTEITLKFLNATLAAHPKIENVVVHPIQPLDEIPSCPQHA